MTREEILYALAGEIGHLPDYPEPDDVAALQEYDEDMNECLEALRDVVTAILTECDYPPRKGEDDEA
jgi:hypothetical protein